MISPSRWFDNSFQFLKLYLGVDIVFFYVLVHVCMMYAGICMSVEAKGPPLQICSLFLPKVPYIQLKALHLQEKKNIFDHLCHLDVTLSLFTILISCPIHAVVKHLLPPFHRCMIIESDCLQKEEVSVAASAAEGTNLRVDRVF